MREVQIAEALPGGQHAVADIIRGLKQRSARVITPRRLRAAALAPGLAQALAERAFFRPAIIRRAVELGVITGPGPTGRGSSGART